MAMDARAIEDRYLRTNKFYGRVVGIWPGQTRTVKYLTRFMTYTVLMSANVTQVAKLVMSFSFTSITDQLPFLMMGFGTLFKQYNYVYNDDRLKELLGGIVSDWLTERPKGELMILEMYSKKADFFSSFYKATAVFTLLMFAILPVIPTVLDIVMPLDEPRERIFIYPAYYFVDEQKYYYFIIGHMLFTSCLVLFSFVQHACALFAISGYRFKHAMEEVYSHNEKDPYEPEDKIYQNLRKSIEAHNKAFEFVKNIEACHVTLEFLAVVLSMITLAVTLMKVTMMEVSLPYFTFCMFVAGQLIHLFFLNMMGQYVVDSNSQTYNKIYDGMWYKGSTKSQFLYMLVLQRCLITPKLTGGKIVDLNLMTFLQIVKASFSYYGLLKTV